MLKNGIEIVNFGCKKFLWKRNNKAKKDEGINMKWRSSSSGIALV